ncbi:hypothetical protein [Mucilaginibacter sp. UYCu711]|uniref:hypothetical protein n=1 Tax=Mucilaginibacter sp. UYCu711 TaxID=3156339 RepID=UPI003D1F22C7
MALSILKIALLLFILIIPLRGPSKRKESNWNVRLDKSIRRSKYGVNEDGNLEELPDEKDKKGD